jgi:hypothetical protein
VDGADCSFSLQEHIPAAIADPAAPAGPFQPVWFLTLNRKRASAGFRRVATANHGCKSDKRNFNPRIAKSTVRWGMMLEIRAAAPFEPMKARRPLIICAQRSHTTSQLHQPSSRAVHVTYNTVRRTSGGMAAITRPLCFYRDGISGPRSGAVHPISPYDQPNP